MNGFISRALALAGLMGGLAAMAGCYHYDQVVDPCYPERYNAIARQEVCQAFTPQVHNGNVLDQTIWNWHFKPGTDELSNAGREHLLYLIRRRPCPDPTIYLAASQDPADLVYDPADPEKFVKDRCDLDAKRQQAIQKYVAAQTAGRHLDFQVVVHDPFETQLNSRAVATSFVRWVPMFTGTIPSIQSVGGGPTIGAVPTSGGTPQ